MATSPAAVPEHGQTTIAPEEKNPMLAACHSCQHVWPILWMPCRAGLVAKAQLKMCPMCGAGKHIFMATAADVPRYAAQLEAELGRVKRELEALAKS